MTVVIDVEVICIIRMLLKFFK